MCHAPTTVLCTAVWQFYKAAKKAGIKPIIGCEVYVATRTRFDKVNRIDGNNHLILLCKNETGYKNLIKMVSAGFTEGFYSKPRIDKELLEQYHEGLICLSACLAGEIPQAILAGDYERAKAGRACGTATFSARATIISNCRTTAWRKTTGRAAPAHPIGPGDRHPHGRYQRRPLHYAKRTPRCRASCSASRPARPSHDADRMEFQTDEFYLKSTDEMYDLFAMVPEACENTNKIAEQCNFEFTFGETKLPYFKAPDGMENQEYFEKLCWEGLERRYGPAKSPHALQRAPDLTRSTSSKRWAIPTTTSSSTTSSTTPKARDIPVGPGRGSGAGSLAAYCVGITDIDPIRYNLIFERFLNPERVSDARLRRRLLLRAPPGGHRLRQPKSMAADHVAQIVTFGTMAARAADARCGPRDGHDRIRTWTVVAKLIPTELKMTHEKGAGGQPRT